MNQDYSTRAVDEAERHIAAGEFPQAIDKLKTAAAYVPWWWDKGDSGDLVARIGELADTIERDAPAYAPQVQAIRDVFASREGHGAPAASDAEPWFYGVAKLVAVLFIIFSVLAFISGIVGGIYAARVTEYVGGPTHDRISVLVLYIVSGIVAALVQLGIAAALNLLVDNGRMLRAMRSQS
jgi:hypothetical protein